MLNILTLMIHKATVRFVTTFFAIAALAGSAAAADKSKGVQMTDADGKVRVEINGEFFTDYIYFGAPHVYYYPVIGPGGAKMTRDYPMVMTPWARSTIIRIIARCGIPTAM